MAKTKQQLESGATCVRRRRTLARKARFLDELRRHGIKSAAAAKVGLSRNTVWELEKEDEAFAREVEEASDVARNSLELTGLACARKAMEDPRYASVLIFALKAKCGWSERTESVSLEHRVVRIVFDDGE